MIRRKGEHFNPYGPWEAHNAVWALLEDADDDVEGNFKAKCVVPWLAAHDYEGEEFKMELASFMFPTATRTGRLAP
jgi:hypothetical protein